MSRFDKEQIRGRWRDVLSRLGVPEKFLAKNKNGPCPLCGGKDRYRFTDMNGDGLYYCSQCGPGDGAALAMKYLNIDFRELVDLINPMVGTARVIQERKTPYDELIKERKAIWNRGGPIIEGDPVDRYLVSRLKRSIHSTELRTLLTDDGAIMLARYMVPNQIRGLSSVHRTFLTKDGKKLTGDATSRKLMRGETIKGGAIRLMPINESGVLGLAEGIETALSASILFGVPVWATISESFLRVCEVPDRVQKVYVFGDNDKNHVGQAAAHECAHRLSRKCEVEVKIPETPGFDWNDVLTAVDSSRLKGYISSDKIAA